MMPSSNETKAVSMFTPGLWWHGGVEARLGDIFELPDDVPDRTWSRD